MIECGLHLDFAQKPLSQVRISFHVRKQHLHGFNALGKNVLDLVDLAHASLAKNFNNLVVANAVADVHKMGLPHP